jgi:peptidoglycan/LPS O-acetylase OafA/YrhL
LPLVFDLGVVTVVAPLLVAILARNDAPRWLAPLGAVSYPLYASHLALVWLAQSTPLFGLDRGPRPFLAAGVVFLAFALAWTIHRLLDPRPAIAQPQRRGLADAGRRERADGGADGLCESGSRPAV